MEMALAFRLCLILFIFAQDDETEACHMTCDWFARVQAQIWSCCKEEAEDFADKDVCDDRHASETPSRGILYVIRIRYKYKT